MKKNRMLCTGFLLAEFILYILILTSGGVLLVASEFLAIVLCFVFALFSKNQDNTVFTVGLACTVAADFCLVICDPIQQLWGMVFFLVAQLMYAEGLHRMMKKQWVLYSRIVFTAVAVIVTMAVLGEKTDALAIISLCYYANLIINMVAAFCVASRNPMLPIAFILFILCDTVIGLQVASGSYLPIAENSFLYRILFMDFHLSWFFYLPSQVLLALHGSGRNILCRKRGQ